VLLSRARSQKYIEEHHPQLVVVLQRVDVWRPIHFAAGADAAITEEEAADLASGVEESIRKAAKAVVDRIDGQTAFEIKTQDFPPQDPASVSKQALLLSRQGWGSKGAWWLSRVGNEGGEAYFPSANFKAAMRHVVFAPFLTGAGRAIAHCPCCQTDARHRVPIGHLYSHAMACERVGNFTWRHNEIRDAVFSLLKKHLPLTARVQREESILRPGGVAGEPERFFRADIFVEQPERTRYIDVAVVDPGCTTYLAAGSATTALAAAVHREADKRNHFADVMPGVDGACFVPFVVETSGRLGKPADDFLRSMQMPAEAVRRLERLIPLLLARHVGRSLTLLREGRVARH